LIPFAPRKTLKELEEIRDKTSVIIEQTHQQMQGLPNQVCDVFIGHIVHLSYPLVAQDK
jgi:hypothetical protein